MLFSSSIDVSLFPFSSSASFEGVVDSLSAARSTSNSSLDLFRLRGGSIWELILQCFKSNMLLKNDLTVMDDETLTLHLRQNEQKRRWRNLIAFLLMKYVLCPSFHFGWFLFDSHLFVYWCCGTSRKNGGKPNSLSSNVRHQKISLFVTQRQISY